MSDPTRKIYARLLHYVVPYWRTFAIALCAMLVLAATEPAIPALLKPAMDGSFVDKDLDAVGTMAALLELVFLVRGASSFLTALAMAQVAGRVVMDLREAMFAHLMVLPNAFFDRQPIGVLVSRITFNATQVSEAASYVVTVLVRDTLAILGLLAWMLYLEWSLTMVALVTAPVVVFAARHFSRRLRRMSHHVQDNMGTITHVVEEALGGHQVVRVFSGEEHERQRFGRVANDARRYGVKFASAAAAAAPVAQFITAVGLAAILYFAARRSAVDEISVGTFVSFFTAMGMLFAPLKRLTSINARLQKGLAAAESIFSLLDETPERDEGTIELERARGELTFEHVEFAYPGETIRAVHDVNLSVAPGETVALVGTSGSGKTTLVKLVPRLYAPTSGRVLIDGRDIADYTLASLRRNVALVSQDIVLFNDTVANNIAYGPLRSASREAVVEAARAAHALEFIEALPQGFETMLGERGMRLSGGQRQRIAIARAFLKDAPILVLDEATSALDSHAERHIQAALEELRRGRTTIVIAHRLSTIERADRIVVLADGRVVETGTHAELLAQGGVYANLYRLQFSGRRHESAPRVDSGQ